jgi:hypothetical protein
MKEFILAIDPGTIESAYCIIEKKTLKPIKFEKILNEDLKEKLFSDKFYQDYNVEECYIEMIASYGMPVGKEVFETCVWIGRFFERCNFDKVEFVYRMEEKMHICNNPKANDATIKKALIDRFGDKGTKKNPGWFYGFSKDVWAAYAVGITGIEKIREGRKNGNI